MRLSIAALLLCFFAACGDSTGPNTPPPHHQARLASPQRDHE